MASKIILSSVTIFLSCSEFVEMQRVTLIYCVSSIVYQPLTSSFLILKSSERATTQLQLPASLDPSKKISLIVAVRDKFDAATTVRLEPVQVTTDMKTINSLPDLSKAIDHPLVTVLHSEDQNIAAPVVQSLVQVFDEIRKQDLDLAEQSRTSPEARTYHADFFFRRNFHRSHLYCILETSKNNEFCAVTHISLLRYNLSSSFRLYFRRRPISTDHSFHRQINMSLFAIN